MDTKWEAGDGWTMATRQGNVTVTPAQMLVNQANPGTSDLVSGAGPWWNSLCDPEIKAGAVYGPKPMTWWQRILRFIGLGRFVKRELFRMTDEQIAEVARSMCQL